MFLVDRQWVRVLAETTSRARGRMSSHRRRIGELVLTAALVIIGVFEGVLRACLVRCPGCVVPTARLRQLPS